MSTVYNRIKELKDIFDRYEICTEESERTQALIDKMEQNSMTISVIGQFKRGKSTLVNAILGEELLPVGIIPVTAAVTKVMYGEREASVTFLNGVVKKIPFDEIRTYINEQENSNNMLNVDFISVKIPYEFLKDGVTFVDTPGVGSVHQNNSDAAYSFVKKSDAVIFMLSVDSPVNQIEIDFLKNARDYAGRFYFAVNKADIISENDLSAYLSYCSNLICDILETDSIRLFPVSAKTGEGIEQLKNHVLSDTKEFCSEIIEESAKKKALDIVNGALRQISLYRAVLRLPKGQIDRKFSLIKKSLEEIKEENRNLVLNSTASQKELSARLNSVKLSLSELVREHFEISYTYALEEIQYGADTSKEDMDTIYERYLEDVISLCDDLKKTLDAVFMYREKDVYTVVRRIEDLNILKRSLDKYKSRGLF